MSKLDNALNLLKNGINTYNAVKKLIKTIKNIWPSKKK